MGLPSRIASGVLGLFGVAAVGAIAFGMCSPDASRRVAARSLRAAVGPPEPPEPLDADDESTGSAAPEVEPDPQRDERDSVDPELLRMGPATPPPRPDRPRGLRGVSYVLVLGMDNRDDRVTGRTDTMMIGAFRHRDGKVAAFSVPRDLWVELPDDLGPARISSVVRIGNVKVGPGQGVPLLERVLKDELGIRIDRYAAVDLEGFVAVVDAVGGIDVQVQCPIVDCFWDGPGRAGADGPTCDRLEVEAGRQSMDGATALKFARSRHGRGDRDRTRRQQAVLVALAHTIRGRGLRRLPALWRAVEPYVDTDLEWDSAAYFASFALETDLSAIGGFAVTKPVVQRHVTVEGKHVLLLDPTEFDDALRGAFRTPLPALKPRRRCPDADVAVRNRPRRN